MALGTHTRGGGAVASAKVTAFNNHSARHADGGDDEITQDHPFDRTAVGTNTTISDPNQIVGCTSGGITVTLASAMVAEGHYVAVNDESGNAGNVNNAITIATQGSETIDGAASLDLNADFEGVILYCDGTNWFSAAAVGTVI